MERYDPQSDSWTIVTNLSSPRCLGSLVALKGCLYAIGGYDGASVLLSLQVFITVVYPAKPSLTGRSMGVYFF